MTTRLADVQTSVSGSRHRSLCFYFFLDGMNSILENTTGYFGPQSATWQIYREPAFLFGSVRALLLQVAHPAVAEGVARFSNFQQDALARGRRTFLAMTNIYFGDRQTADFTAKKMNAMHRHIRGNFPSEKVGRVVPQPYEANDPALKLWVLATLFDTSILAYETILKPLPLEIKQRFFEESKVTARLMEIPAEIYPADFEAFNLYFQNMLHGGELAIGETGRQLCQSILEHKLAPRRLSRLLAIGFLPPHLVEAFGIKVLPGDQRKFERAIQISRIGYRLTPPPLRYCPAWHQAMRRVALAEKQRPSLLQTMYGWLEKWVDVPLGMPSNRHLKTQTAR